MIRRTHTYRVIGAVAVAAATLSLAACGSSSSPPAQSAASADPASTAAANTNHGAPAWCGTKPIVFGMADGGGLNAWSKASAASVTETVKHCPNVTRVLTSHAGFNLQTAITGLQSMVAQGANAIVIIPDAGGPGTQLEGIRSATEHGVAIVPWGAQPGGAPGSDYLAYVDANHKQAGEVWAQWVAKQLPSGGDVAFLSGPAGNGPGLQEVAGIQQVLKAYPKIHLVTGNAWAVDNWDPAMGQQAMAGLLSKYPDIAGVISDEGITTTGILRAFQSANRPLPAVASLEANGLSCEWQSLHKSFKLAMVSAENFPGRVAAQLAIAKAAGVKLTSSDEFSPTDILPDPLLEDSTNPAAQPVCDHSQPQSALLSNNMTDSQLMALTRTGTFPKGVQ
jgi:ribose transport system substrate-binding protein